MHHSLLLLLFFCILSTGELIGTICYIL